MTDQLWVALNRPRAMPPALRLLGRAVFRVCVLLAIVAVAFVVLGASAYVLHVSHHASPAGGGG